MKRLKIIALVLAASLGASQAQAMSSMLKTLPQQPWVQKSIQFVQPALNYVQPYVQPLVEKGQQWVTNNPKKTKALGAGAAIYGLYKTCCLIKHIKTQLTGTPEEKLFGYNPNYSKFPTKKDTKKTALIFSHGFGDSKNGSETLQKEMARLWNKFGKDYFPITFNYGDVVMLHGENEEVIQPTLPDIKQIANQNSKENKNQPQKTNISDSLKIGIDTTIKFFEQFSALRRINLGGLPDAEVLLYAIKNCADAGKDIVLYGHSRGGAAIIRVLHMFEYPDQYISTWEKFGLTKRNWRFALVPDNDRINAIAIKIKQVYLANPLLDMKAIFNNISEKAVGKIVNKTELDPEGQKFTAADRWKNDAYDEQEKEDIAKRTWRKKTMDWFKKSGSSTAITSSNLISDVMLTTFTEFKSPRWEKQPIELLQEMCKTQILVQCDKTPRFKIHFSFAKPDDVVTNTHDKDVEELANKSMMHWEIAKDKNSNHCDQTVTINALCDYINK